MLQALKATLLELAGSKKVLLFFATLIAWAAARLGLNIEQSQINNALMFVSSLLLAQGIADHGKPAADKNAQLAAAIALEPGPHREAALRQLAKLPPANTNAADRAA
jgi:hypothetical protein